MSFNLWSLFFIEMFSLCCLGGPLKLSRYYADTPREQASKDGLDLDDAAGP